MVKIGRRFFFNQSHVKKNRIITIVSIVTVVIIILVTFFITNYFYDNTNDKPTGKITLKDYIEVEIYNKVPSVLSYFKVLENIQTKDIQISYDEDFTYDEDLSSCTEEEINIINKIRNQEMIVENNVDYFKCLSFIPNKTGYYNVNFDIAGTKMKTQLRVVDTQAPVLTPKNITITDEDSYYASDFVSSCTDNSKQDCYIEFYNPDRGQRIDYSKYKNPGSYEIKIVGKDNSGNQTEPQTATLTINAVKYYTVTFNSNGGTAVDSQRVREGERAFSAYPTRNGYYFDGWLLGKSKYNFENPINSDITLTASWKKISTPSSGGGNSSGGSSSSGSSNSGSSNNGSSTEKCKYGTYDDSYEDVSMSATLITGRNMKDCANKNDGSEFAKLETYANDILKDAIGTAEKNYNDGYLTKEVREYYGNQKNIHLEGYIEGVNNNKGGFVGIRIIVTVTEKNNNSPIDTYEAYDCTTTICKFY
ncbi:MAG: InlB B-repeat-containing protein [Bacilli bacterium]|nr:InlB B-repeat-containing protein [Bacilli bacterium]